MTSPVSDLEDGPQTAALGRESDESSSEALRRRFVRFATVFCSIVLSATWFVTATWSHFSGATSLAWQLVPLGLAVGFVASMLLSFRYRSPAVQLLYTVSAASLGLVNFGLAAAAGCWLVAGVAALLRVPLDSHILAIVFFGGAALATAYGIVNAAWLRTKRVTVRLPNLPPAWHGRHVALVSDVHVGNVRGYRFVRHIVARLRRLNPDAVLIAGDMFDGAKVDLDRVAQPWAALSAPAGAYFVTGNHDEFTDRTNYLDALSRSGLRVLNNEKVIVDGLQILGVHDGEAGEPELYRAILRRMNLDRDCASILLTHQPTHLAIPEEAGVSVQFSGHTHRGQFWPWSSVIWRVHGKFAYGLNRFGSLQVLTSSGAGTWGPPLRVGTSSEIVLIRLEASA